MAKLTEQAKENLLQISWSDGMWAPHLNSSNVLDYFSERTNPFYSRDCNNEFLKMQQNTRLDQLTHMQGIEYILLHAQEPILYIVRKQNRYSPTQATALNNYHIIGGTVFQTPDLGAAISSRVVSAIHHVSSAFSEIQSASQYNPSRGYWWQFRNQPEQIEPQKEKEKVPRREESSSVFQQMRVDRLLEDLQRRFPYKLPQVIQGETVSVKNEAKVEVKLEVKTESNSSASGKPPPEKRQRTAI